MYTHKQTTCRRYAARMARQIRRQARREGMALREIHELTRRAFLYFHTPHQLGWS